MLFMEVFFMQLIDRGAENKAARVFPLILSICIVCALLMLPSAVSSASNHEELADIKGHWAENVIMK